MEGTSLGANRPVVMVDEYGPTRMIRTESSKYVHRYPDGPYEFYDLVGDPDETVSEVDNPAFAESISTMRGQLEEWFDKYRESERDGRDQTLKGRGQLDLAGTAEAFAQGVVFLRDT
jgi:choline-sulfatase